MYIVGWIVRSDNGCSRQTCRQYSSHKRSSWKKMWVPLLLLVIIVASGFALISIFFYTVSHDNFLTRGDVHGTGQKSETKLYYAPAVDVGDDISTYDIYLKESE